MKNIFLFLLFLLAAPGTAFAHASPVEYIPASSATVTEAPKEVVIRFSERPEPGASRISVTDAKGREVAVGRATVSAEDRRVLSIAIEPGEQGPYFVAWSVVSSDDGHFTKGGYTYFIGDTAANGVAAAPQVAVIQLSALPEATAIAVELLGNSLLLASLIAFAFVIRPRMKDMAEEARKAASRIHAWIVGGGAVIALTGALAHIVLKTSELATLHVIAVAGALPLYLGTVSGSATVVRAVVVLLFAVVFLFRRRAIHTASRITISEGLLAVLLAIFAYFRAVVSHATANPFLPELGIAVNYIHLIAKDLSAGLLVTLALLMLAKPLRKHVPAFLRRGFRLVALLFIPLVASAAYIVWLHLKGFENLSSTLWGERFVPLLCAALVAAGLLAYHVLGARRIPEFVKRNLKYTLPAEAVAGIAIVFFSSLMIITSPPLHGAPDVLKQSSNGITISLAASSYEEGVALLTFAGATLEKISDPVIMLDADGDGGLMIEAERRFPGGYAFPTALLTGTQAHTMSVIVAQEGGYDARATFVVAQSDLSLPEEGVREFDLFALVMLALALAGIVGGLIMLRKSRAESWEEVEPGSILRLCVASVVAVFVMSWIMGAAVFSLGNVYKRECVQDGNSWHLMLPARDGQPASSVPAEGCMALAGAFHLPDAREYRSLKSPRASFVEFGSDLESLRAGVPTMLSFSIKNEDGTPARLSVQHEKLVHFVVVSKDANEFFHVHPEEYAPPSEDGEFSLPFTFPKAGEYIIGIDYASGLAPRSTQVKVTVDGAPALAPQPTVYPLRGSYDGYDITLQPGFPVAGQPATLVWRIQKEGKDVTDLSPYLAAAMHVAVVKDDLSEFAHTHGEVHIPGAPIKKLSATNVHNHAPPPQRFGPFIEAHPVFPSEGDYTLFAQFVHEGRVITAPFSLRVE